MRYVYCHYETKSSYKNIYFQDECPICFAAKPQIYLLCGHIFHDDAFPNGWKDLRLARIAELHFSS